MLKTQHSLEELKTSGIYKIVVEELGSVYIGSTSSFIRRVKNHRTLLNRDKHHNKKLTEYFNLGYTLNFSIEEEVLDLNLLWEKELHYIYLYENTSINQTNFTKNVDYGNAFFSGEQISNIAEMYNSGLTCSQISLELFNTRDYRSTINSLVKGESYPNFKHLFNYIPYTQQGKKRGAFSCSPKYRHLSYKDKMEAVKTDTDYIIENIGKKSGRALAKELSLDYRGVGMFIRKYKIENNIVWEERLTDDIKNIYTKRHGIKTEKYNIDGMLLEVSDTIYYYKDQGFFSEGIKKSSETGKPYKGFIFKIKENEL
jgi:hypothetical protein